MSTDPRAASSASASNATPPARRMASVRVASPSLEVAARSILDGQVRSGTVASVVAERALDHHWEGLFQYAAVRVGSEVAGELLKQLALEERDAVADREREPSAPGHLYRRMRELAGQRPRVSLSATASLWWVPGAVRLRRKVVAVRTALDDQEREVLELRHARALSSADVAHVLDLPLPEVQQVEAQASAKAERVLGVRPESQDGSLAGAFLETFALHPKRAIAPRRQDREPVLNVGDVVESRYEVEALLGAGAFADVYRARDRDVTDHVVALKILRAPAADARSIEVALRELQLIASVFHPSVVQLKDHGWHDGHLWFVMPLYQGETLGSRLARGPLGRTEARRIFEPLAEALATMHRAGVLHQDIKPENVFLAYLDEQAPPHAERRVLPVLLDLGVAAKNAELVLAGTPAYLAPEVAARFAGRADPPMTGPKADVFALALTLRQALDPQSPAEVPGGTVDAFIDYRARRAPPPPRGKELQDLRPQFERWLHFSPDQRPSAEQFRRQLAALTRPQERAARRMALVRTVAPIAVAVMTLFGAAVYHLSQEASQQRTEASHARQRVATVSQDLMRQQTRRRALEADVERLREKYQESRMTREQLASRLAETEGQLQVTQGQQAQSEGLVLTLSERLRELRKERERALQESEQRASQLEELNGRLSQTARQLDAEQGRHREAQAAQARLREELGVYEQALKEKTALLQGQAGWQGAPLMRPPPTRFVAPGAAEARASTLP